MGHRGPCYRKIENATEKATRAGRGDRGGLLRFDRARRFWTPAAMAKSLGWPLLLGVWLANRRPL